jgi:hypothetical protein
MNYYETAIQINMLLPKSAYVRINYRLTLMTKTIDARVHNKMHPPPPPPLGGGQGYGRPPAYTPG